MRPQLLQRAAGLVDCVLLAVFSGRGNGGWGKGGIEAREELQIRCRKMGKPGGYRDVGGRSDCANEEWREKIQRKMRSSTQIQVRCGTGQTVRDLGTSSNSVGAKERILCWRLHSWV